MTRICGSPGRWPTLPLLLNHSSHTVFAGVSTKNQVLKPNLDTASLTFPFNQPQSLWPPLLGYNPVVFTSKVRHLINFVNCGREGRGCILRTGAEAGAGGLHFQLMLDTTSTGFLRETL